ncbi:MAG: helix-turn-helix domain-containing protein [Candidatus Bathyarchaeia archaeon]
MKLEIKALLKGVCVKGWHDKGRLKSLLVDKAGEREIGEIEETLTKLGLSKKKAKVYIFLAMGGGRKASESSSALSLNRAESYKVLMKMQKMGLVSIMLEKPLKFTALPLEDSLNLLIESKKKKLNIKILEEEKLIGIWRSLPNINLSPIKREFLQVLEG